MSEHDEFPTTGCHWPQITCSHQIELSNRESLCQRTGVIQTSRIKERVSKPGHIDDVTL
jgi:hypothetical protein